MKTITTMGFSVFTGTPAEIPLTGGKCALLTTISPISYGIATKDQFFREALLKSDYLVLDGVYFALATIFIRGKNIKKNQASDVFYHFMARVDKVKGRVFFLGSSDETLEKIKTKCLKEYPGLNVGCYSPPYRSEFSEDDTREMISAVNKFRPDVLFIGITCPKQEKWAYRNKDLLDTKLICCIGAVFDWFAGTRKAIAPIWWKLRLGWLKRAIDRPEVLRRYPNIGIFFQHLLLALFGIRKYRNGAF
jgi:N-acetylglucosaminyldiphosphoundecaprenol N-acetyl-beta-D-mannosaminyltransferase